MQSTNDGSIGYGTYKAPPDSNLVYMSNYNYAPGTGYNVGIQIGYTWYLIPRLGINIELGARYARFRTQDQHYGSVNNKFDLLYFPETIGIRWRF
jgi:hypothetical protein